MLMPTPLRILCTKSVMVPALAEAATQSRGRLTTSQAQPNLGEGQGLTKDKISTAGSMSHLGPPQEEGGKNNKQVKQVNPDQILGSKLVDGSGNRIYGVKLLDPKEKAPQIMGANGTANTGHKITVTTAKVAATGQALQSQVKQLTAVPTVSSASRTKPAMVRPGQLMYDPTAAGSVAGTTGQLLHPITNGIGTMSHKIQPSSQKVKEMQALNTVGLRLAKPLGIPVSSALLSTTLSRTISHTATLSKSQQTVILPIPTSSKLQISNSGAATISQFNPTTEASKRHFEIERRLDRLTRRLRRLQSRQCVSHVQRELSAFVDHQSDVVQRITGVSRSAPKDVETQLLQSEDVKNLSTAALVSLVRRLQSTHANALRQRLANAVNPPEPPREILLERDSCYEMKRVAGVLSQSLHHVQSTMDSDATESSSGGESCDEDGYEDRKPTSPVLESQARFKWAEDRASIASRWTWLQAQVSDLEYRIRQQNDIYRQIRTSKGPVLLGEHPAPEDLLAKSRPKAGRRLSPIEQKIANIERKNEMSPSPISTLLNNTDKQTAKLIQSLGSVFSPGSASGSSKESSPRTPNGLVDGNHGEATTDAMKDSISKKPKLEPAVGDSPVVEDTCQAARCRPVRTYRKRKLFRTGGLYQTSRKAARLSTVRCRCYPPVTPCPMCGGRYNNVQTVDAELMSLPERIAILDNSYHPVLSFSQEVNLSLHFEALLKNGDWQNKLPSRNIKLLDTTRKRYKPVVPEQKRKYTKRVNKSASAAVLSSTKIKNKYEQNQLSRTLSMPGTPKRERTRRYPEKLKKRKAAVHAIASLKKRDRESAMSSSSGRLRRRAGSLSSQSTEKDMLSQLNQSCPSRTFQDMKDVLKKRRGESAYDINNIVIPYSMASSTRVEKLQYKEILTPRWRQLPEETVIETKAEDTSTEDQVEDLSDDVFAERHARCEVDEKRRFLNFSQIQKRGGRPGRSESSSTVSGDNSQGTDGLLRSGSGTFLRGLSGDTQIKMEADGAFDKPDEPLTPKLEGHEIKQELPDVFTERTHCEHGENSIRHCESTPKIAPPRSRSGSLSRVRSCSSLSTLEKVKLQEVEEDYLVTPWEERHFPLAEAEYELMKLGMEDSKTTPLRVSTRSTGPCHTVDALDTPGSGSSTVTAESGRGSPMTTSSDEELPEEDPDDPEWTVLQGGVRTPKPGGLVLKLTRK